MSMLLMLAVWPCCVKAWILNDHLMNTILTPPVFVVAHNPNHRLMRRHDRSVDLSPGFRRPLGSCRLEKLRV